MAAVAPLLLQMPQEEIPIVVEAEAPVSREGGGPSFARPHAERWASGRQCLIRFYGEGRCTYALDVPTDRQWYLWLRYAATSTVTLAAGFAGEEELAEHELASTGASSGKGAFGWALLHAGELTAGRHLYVVEAAPLRPDCLLLTTRAGVPDYLAPPEVAQHDERTLELLAQPLVPARPDWLDEAVGYELPEWFDGTRLCMHTRLSPRWLLCEPFEEAAASFRSLGARCYVRHFKTLGEGAWWPSVMGPKELWASRVDVARGIVERAHGEGLRIIAYYRHMEDRGMAERHPAWACRDDRGELVLRRGGQPMLCFNTPAAQYVERRLLELVERGVDGFYFDEVHMPPDGCWCDHCRQAFHAATGLEHPSTIDEDDPLHRKLQDFTNLTIERTFLRWRRAIHARNPEAVLLVGSYRAGGLLDRHASDRLMRLADSVKTEFDKGADGRVDLLLAKLPDLSTPPRDVRLACGWTWCRDAADGRPPHVWIPHIESEATACLATAAVIAHGGVANLDHPEESLPDPATFGAAVALGNRLSDHLGGARPLRWVALHVPGRARDRLAPDVAAWWREGCAPLYEAFGALLRRRLPVGLVSDCQLAEGALDGYQALFLPSPADLTGEMRASVERFRDGGGRVVESGDVNELLFAVEPLRAELPLEVVGGSEGMHAITYRPARGDGVILALVNDFAGVRTVGATGKATATPVCEGVRVRFRSQVRPTRILEAVSGVELVPTPTEGGFEVSLPPFPVAALVVLEP